MARKIVDNGASSSSNTKVPPGEYPFEVKDAKEWQSPKTKNWSYSLTLTVRAENDIPVYDNLWLLTKCEWKWKACCKALGIEYTRDEMELGDFIGQTGIAKFDYGDKYLEVAEYLPKDGSDDVPF